MNRGQSYRPERFLPLSPGFPRGLAAVTLLLLCCWAKGAIPGLMAAERIPDLAAPAQPPVIRATAEAASNAAPHFSVTAYEVRGNPSLPANVLKPLLLKHTGTNVGLEEIVQAAADVQRTYRQQGHPAMSVALAREQITNGIVTLNVFPTAIPQIVVSGIRYLVSTNSPEVAAPGTVTNSPAAATAAPPPAISPMTKPASPEAMAEVRAALFQKVAELAVQEKPSKQMRRCAASARVRKAV